MTHSYLGIQPTLYGFDSSPGSITLSTSYYVQKMFATNKGDTILPVQSSTKFGPVYWVASKKDSQYFVKLANYGSVLQSVTVNVAGTAKGKIEMLAGGQYQGNKPHDMRIEPVTTNVNSTDGSYLVEMEPWSVAVLAVR